MATPLFDQAYALPPHAVLVPIQVEQPGGALFISESAWAAAQTHIVEALAGTMPPGAGRTLPSAGLRQAADQMIAAMAKTFCNVIDRAASNQADRSEALVQHTLPCGTTVVMGGKALLCELVHDTAWH